MQTTPKHHIFYILFLVIFGWNHTRAQDLGALGDSPPVSVSGSVSARLQAYGSNRDEPSREPLGWVITGSPTINLYGIAFPFSFTISDMNRDFRQPFNRFGASPYYKWLTVHLGYRSINMSKYTLAGHTFLGAGIEAEPSIFRFAFIYGRFMKSILPDTTLDEYVIPSYKRTGYATKIGVGTKTNNLDIILFKAIDDTSSAERTAYSGATLPQENLALGIKTKNIFFRKIFFDADIGISALTRNLYTDSINPGQYPFKSLVESLYTPNYSTQVLTAGDIALGLRLKRARLQFEYKRIEPEYTTLGSYYFTNDLESFTFSPSWGMFKQKLRLNFKAGIQRNNLFDYNTNNTLRRAFSAHATYLASATVQASASYSNIVMEQTRNEKVLVDVIDSLRMEQFAQTINGNLNYSFGPRELRQSLNFSTSVQISGDENNYTEELNNSRSFTPSVYYRRGNKDSGLGIRAGISGNIYRTPQLEANRTNLMLGLSKSFMEKIDFDASAQMGFTSINGENDGTRLTGRMGGSYRLSERQSINLNINLITFKSARQNKTINEFLGSAGYTFSF